MYEFIKHCNIDLHRPSIFLGRVYWKIFYQLLRRDNIYLFYNTEIKQGTLEKLQGKIGSRHHLDFLRQQSKKKAQLQQIHDILNSINRSTFYSKSVKTPNYRPSKNGTLHFCTGNEFCVHVHFQVTCYRQKSAHLLIFVFCTSLD